MAAEIRPWRYFIICHFDRFCRIFILCQSFTRCLECFVLDNFAFCIRQCGRKKFCAGKHGASVVLLSIGKPISRYIVKNFLQYIHAFAHQLAHVSRLGSHGWQPRFGDPSVFDGDFVGFNRFFNHFYIHFGDSRQSE